MILLTITIILVLILSLDIYFKCFRPRKEISIGALHDLSSVTSDIGQDIAFATQEVVQYINDTGGIRGIPIKLYQYDTRYHPSHYIKAYEQLRSDGVLLITSWSTLGTKALISYASRDHCPIISHSSVGFLTDPRISPYNFVYNTDYSTSVRGAVILWYENVWLKDPRYCNQVKKSILPRILCIYDHNTIYSSSPIRALYDQASSLGFRVLPDLHLALNDVNALNNFISLAKWINRYKPHVIWHGNNKTQVSYMINILKQLNICCDHLVNTWGFDSSLSKLMKNSSFRVFGIVDSSLFGENVPLMEHVVAYAKKINPTINIGRRESRTVQTWILFLMIREILVSANGNFSGSHLRQQFENLTNWTPGLGRTPLSITPNDHRISSTVKLYELFPDGAKYFISICMRERFPEGWRKRFGD